MNFKTYEVGKSYENAFGHQEGVYFDMSDSGAVLIVYFYEPTKEEVEQFSSQKNFELKCTVLSEVILLTCKIGNLNWMDAPYHPRLSSNLSKYEFPNDGQGLSIQLMLFDTSSGKLMSNRLIGTSTEFTRKLFGNVMELCMKPFDKNVYALKLNNLYSKYSTKDFVNMASFSFKIRV